MGREEDKSKLRDLIGLIICHVGNAEPKPTITSSPDARIKLLYKKPTIMANDLQLTGILIVNIARHYITSGCFNYRVRLFNV